jgi:hypothetical protein
MCVINKALVLAHHTDNQQICVSIQAWYARHSDPHRFAVHNNRFLGPTFLLLLVEVVLLLPACHCCCACRPLIHDMAH